MDRNLIKKNNSDTQISRSLRGNVDRNLPWAVHPYNLKRRSLRGNVDRNDTVYVGAGTIRSRSLRGNVDRNLSSIG